MFDLEERSTIMVFWYGKLKERCHLDDPDVEGRYVTLCSSLKNATPSWYFDTEN
jgi:hypothetical protein